MTLGFHARLVIVNTLVVAALLAALGFIAVESSRRTALRLVDQDLNIRARQISRAPLPLGPDGGSIPADRPPPNRPGEPPRPDRPFGPPNGEFPPMRPPGQSPDGPPNGPGPGWPGRFADPLGGPAVINPAGQVVAPEGRSRPWSAALASSVDRQPRFETAVVNERVVRIIAIPVLREGRVLGQVQAAQDLEGVEIALRGQVQALLLLLPVGVALSALAGWLLARSALGPVGKATQAASAIAASGRLDQRLAVSGTDEMGRLAAAFNEMIERIRESLATRDLANQRLESALEDQKRFTADASHELRTPLTRIILAADNALASPQAGPESLKVIHGAARGMSTLVEQLLLLAKADSGRLPLAMTTLDLRLPVAEALLVSGLSEDERVAVELGDGPLPAWADQDAVKRILINLLDNAARYSPPGGPISVSAQEGQGWVEIVVQDSGTGLEPGELARLSERFYRVDSSRTQSTGGHGLGLAICRSLAEAMGGRISFASEPGSGLQVRLFLRRQSPSS